MTISYLIPSFVQSAILARVTQYTVGTVMGLTMIAFIASRAGSSAEVVLHVTEANVEVSVGSHTLRIDDRSYEPIIFHLAPGPYELVMTRADHVLYREAFQVRSGETCVLTAYNANRFGSDPSPP